MPVQGEESRCHGTGFCRIAKSVVPTVPTRRLLTVVPAKAGTQSAFQMALGEAILDSRVRGNDGSR